jgi:hypothetical protein
VSALVAVAALSRRRLLRAPEPHLHCLEQDSGTPV